MQGRGERKGETEQCYCCPLSLAARKERSTNKEKREGRGGKRKEAKKVLFPPTTLSLPQIWSDPIKHRYINPNTHEPNWRDVLHRLHWFFFWRVCDLCVDSSPSRTDRIRNRFFFVLFPSAQRRGGEWSKEEGKIRSNGGEERRNGFELRIHQGCPFVQ